MNTVFAQIDRSRFLSFAVIFMAACGLLIAIFSTMAIQATKAYELSEAQTGNCYTQLASDPTATFTSTNASAVQTAINAAPFNDIIKIAGTCRGISYTHGLSQTAYIDKDITLMGGFTITNWITPGLTAISVLDANRAGRVIYINGASIITITNLQISNGDATGLGGDPYIGVDWDAGGGVYIAPYTYSYSKFKNVHILNNKAALGAGLFNYSNSVSIENSRITGNFGRDDGRNEGGGIFNFFGGYAFISNTLIMGNIFTNTVDNASGAGILNFGHAIITDSTFKDNVAGYAHDGSGNGGAINNNGPAHMTINKTNILNNQANSGGGIINFATLTITASTLSQNNAIGGGAISNGGGLNIEQSTIDNNNAMAGAGISNSDFLTITNSTISDNNGAYGAAIRSQGTLSSQNNTIIRNNSSNSDGGALDNDYALDFPSEAFLSNTLIGNNNPHDCAFRGEGTIISEGYNLDSDATCMQNSQNSDVTANDIGVASLANNGGDTLTNALLPTSPAIDAGNCSNGAISIDQRGMPRPQNSSCDIGSFEAFIIRNYLPTIISNGQN